MTAFGSVHTAVEAMKIGAFDYVPKPFEIEEMEVKIAKAIEHRRLRHEVDYLRPVDYALGRTTAEAAPTVRIELWVEQIRAGSFTVAYELYDGDVLASTARSVLVPFDLVAQRPRRISPDERAFLLRYAPGTAP